tara:strand:- start:3468 stop:4553 length:1086 start_codon:yes stop_codon:yes gene_type:complete
MPSSKNSVIIACAGSGKTTRLVNDAIAASDKRIAIVTYTNNNAREITRRFDELNSGVPNYVEVMTWFGFLLRECVRPFQRSKYDKKRIQSLLFVNQMSARGSKETDTERHYLFNGDMIYSDKIAKFAVKCEEASSNAVTSRLGQIYTDLYFDEFQDLAGWDLEVIEMLLQSGIRTTLVGDPRQHIYSTHPSNKNSQYLGIKLLDLLSIWNKNQLCVLEPMSNTHRCNELICEFANRLWPNMEAMSSLHNETTEHDGVFLVASTIAKQYIQHFKPQVLRYDKRANDYGANALNFGLSKGLQFDRVLVVPTGPIKKYLASGDLVHLNKSKDKLHVAITRARHSVAFVYDGPSTIISNRWPQTN